VCLLQQSDCVHIFHPDEMDIFHTGRMKNIDFNLD
jgi:hypothetical protein